LTFPTSCRSGTILNHKEPTWCRITLETNLVSDHLMPHEKGPAAKLILSQIPAAKKLTKAGACANMI
jgi:hypothetical protein